MGGSLPTVGCDDWLVEQDGFELAVHFWNFLTSVPEGVLPFRIHSAERNEFRTAGSDQSVTELNSQLSSGC